MEIHNSSPTIHRCKCMDKQHQSQILTTQSPVISIFLAWMD